MCVIRQINIKDKKRIPITFSKPNKFLFGYDVKDDVDENQITQEPKQETKQDVTQDTAQDTKPSYRTAGIRVLPQKGWRSYISYL